MREAIVMIRALGFEDIRPALDYDPIHLPINRAGLVDPNHEPLVVLVDRLAEDEADRQFAHMTLVWADNRKPVRVSCPRCSTVVDAAGGMLSDWVEGTGTVLVCQDCM